MICRNTPVNIPLAPFGEIEDVGPITIEVDTATIDRLTAWAKAHLATLSPERRAELERGQ